MLHPATPPRKEMTKTPLQPGWYALTSMANGEPIYHIYGPMGLCGSLHLLPENFALFAAAASSASAETLPTSGIGFMCNQCGVRMGCANATPELDALMEAQQKRAQGGQG